jgi:hypothetical protein
LSRPLHAQNDLARPVTSTGDGTLTTLRSASTRSLSTPCYAKLSLLLCFHHLHRFHLGGNSCLEPNCILRVHASYRIFVISLVPLVCSSYSISVIRSCYCALSLLLAGPFRHHNRIPLIHLFHTPKYILLFNTSRCCPLPRLDPFFDDPALKRHLPPIFLLSYNLVSTGLMASR